MRVPRLREIGGAFYWRPTPAVRELGFENVALGKDIAEAIKGADRLNKAVDRARAGRPAEPAHGSVAWVIRAILGAVELKYPGMLSSNAPRRYPSSNDDAAQEVADLGRRWG